MQQYSPFFTTLHDEQKPVGFLGRGTHYSILRAVIWETRMPSHFHDLAVIWDEDHDTRIIWTIENLFIRGLLSHVLAIGERKGNVTTLTERPASTSLVRALHDIAQDNPGDPFFSVVTTLDQATSIIGDDDDRVRAYLNGIRALWGLGTTPIIVRPPAVLNPSEPNASSSKA